MTKKGTRIFKHGEGAANPSRGVTKKEATRALKANAAGKDVDAKRLKQAKSKAKDHYASEANEAAKTAKKRWF